jgi:hypothetical protein
MGWEDVESRRKMSFFIPSEESGQRFYLQVLSEHIDQLNDEKERQKESESRKTERK